MKLNFGYQDLVMKKKTTINKNHLNKNRIESLLDLFMVYKYIFVNLKQLELQKGKEKFVKFLVLSKRKEKS